MKNEASPDPKSSLIPVFLGITIAALLVAPQHAKEFRAAGLRWVHVLFLSTALSYAFVPLAIRLAHILGAVDQPDARKIHIAPTPRLGGAAVFLSFILALLANGVFSQRLLAVAAASTVIFILGALDDIRPLSALIRLAFQTVACAVLIYGDVCVALIPRTQELWWLVDIPLTVGWVICVTNAFNFLDGMDGLAGGLGGITGLILSILAFRTGAADLGWACLALLGACAGFMPFNFRPGRRAMVFLGDSGSTFLGFVLASLAILGVWSENNPLTAVFVPILVFWVPLFDLAYTSIERTLSGKVSTLGELLSYTGKDHIHHRFLTVFGNRSTTVLFIYIFAGSAGLSAVAMTEAGSATSLLLIAQASMVAGLLSAIEIAARANMKVKEDAIAVNNQSPARRPKPFKIMASKIHGMKLVFARKAQ